jgi:uncharacterized protein (DUF2235 family)
MGKNIILCSDGTGNTAIKDRGTNVFKLFEAIDLNPTLKQKVFYDDGVGTESFKLFKLLGGAFGLGLSRNVRQLYASLARVYEPDDAIYLFGFSRGAFTVRTLAGFISHCGVLDAKRHCQNDAELMNKVEGAYKAYRRRYKTIASDIWRRLFKWNTKHKYGFTEAVEFRQQYAHHHAQGDTPIHFIGVWDTVSAVGFPLIGVTKIINKLYRVSFPDHKLGKNVANAYQALSIDDKRKTFFPEMWDESLDGEGANKRIHQVWFAGVHANVGGGYPKQGMSLVALDWMMENAHNKGLQFIPAVRERIRTHANVNDKLYDSRSGLAVYYRYAPRDIHALSQKFNIKVPLIHNSVLRRSLDVTDGYAPGNLPKTGRFVATGQEGYVNEYESALFKQEMGKNNTLLERVVAAVTLRMRLHPLFYVLTAIFVYLMIKKYSFSAFVEMASDPTSMTFLKSSAIVLLDSIWLLIPAVLVLWLSVSARSQIQNSFSRFWYALNAKLPSSGGKASLASDIAAAATQARSEMTE